jgi:aryl sulfotransferase
VSASHDLIWLASFPKSGNTWFRIFLANLDARGEVPVDINDLGDTGSIASNRYEFEAETLLDSGLLTHDDIDRLRPAVYTRLAHGLQTRRWMKIHDAYTLNLDGEPLVGRVARGAVYIVRDPRDVAVSLAHHNNTTTDAAIAILNDPDAAFSRPRKAMALQLRQKMLNWSGHVMSWLDQRDLPVHCIRYEDLVADPVRYFAAALAFVGHTAGETDIRGAVGHADFAELQRQESEKGFGERTSRTSPFFRAGRVGGWQEVLSAKQTAQLQEAHGAVMERLGYSL